MPEVLFVCTGNTCRSPMAAGIVRFLLEKKGLANLWSVSSRGLMAEDGALPSELAVKVLLEEYGIDISSHRAAQVTESDLAAASLIVAMTVSQVEQIKRLFPAHADRVYLYGALVDPKRQIKMQKSQCHEGLPRLFLPEGYEVIDPYGGDEELYRAVARQLWDYGKRLVEMIEGDNFPSPCDRN
ncbi:MAG: ribose 5-phosphate isomerase [Synergistaceae bacterium]|nr:ribose 5-phosphate isomerase [Synergistaceae bacterium]